MFHAVKKRSSDLQRGELVFTRDGNRATFWGEFRRMERAAVVLWNPIILSEEKQMGMPDEVWVLRVRRHELAQTT